MLAGPTVTLTVTPRVGLVSPGNCNENGLVATARVHVVDPKNDLYCPQMLWVWDDGSSSARQGDCYPDGGTGESWESLQHRYCTPGQYTITVILKSSTTERRVSQSLEIR